jgi:deoxyribodipyrimidine photo-lyase
VPGPPWKEASRGAAFGTLQQFLPRAGSEYAAQRNFDYGPAMRSNVSGLSEYVRHRLILESEVLEATLQRHSFVAASKFIDEVFWRAYFKGWLEHHPTVWTDYRSVVQSLVDSLETNSDLKARYERAIHAGTGIDCFDAWVNELISTGYLHNHARMWFASIWVYTLQLPWQLGADFFYRHLVDGDPASNTLSWRWVCGLHTKGKTYLARISNIASYTAGRFNPQGLLAHDAKPLNESQIHASPLPVGLLARQFAIGAVADGVERAALHFGLPAQGAQSDSWDDVLVAWARSNDLDAVVTAYAPVGPVAERLASARQSLANNRIELIQLMRAYDTCTWPHATKGYFKLKSMIPDVLERLGITGETQDAQRASN